MIPKTQAVAYLKAVLRGAEPLDAPRVLALFQAYPPTDDSAKMAAIHDPRAAVTIVSSDYGSKCYSPSAPSTGVYSLETF